MLPEGDKKPGDAWLFRWRAALTARPRPWDWLNVQDKMRHADGFRIRPSPSMVRLLHPACRHRGGRVVSFRRPRSETSLVRRSRYPPTSERRAAIGTAAAPRWPRLSGDGHVSPGKSALPAKPGRTPTRRTAPLPSRAAMGRMSSPNEDVARRASCAKAPRACHGTYVVTLDADMSVRPAVQPPGAANGDSCNAQFKRNLF